MIFSPLSVKNLKPKFLHNAAGDLFIQITVGNSKLERMLPKMETVEEASAYIDKLVPEMAKELYRRRRNKLKRERKSR